MGNKLERVEELLPDKAPLAAPLPKTMEERWLELQERQVAIQEEQLRVQQVNQRVQQEQLKQTRTKSNALGPAISPFNPRGDKDFPRPELKCEMWIPHKITSADLGGLTREEAELLNLLEPGEYTIRMVDQAKQVIAVVGERDNLGRLEKLAMMGPRGRDGHPAGLFTRDNRHRFPSLTSMLRQMINGIDDDGTIQRGPADAVMTMGAEIKLIRDGQLTVSVGE